MLCDISIHALREEGDSIQQGRAAQHGEFLSTPSARRATQLATYAPPKQVISIHALREEGDLLPDGAAIVARLFLSTPSARRATARAPTLPPTPRNFYPRPPRGGRRL